MARDQSTEDYEYDLAHGEVPGQQAPEDRDQPRVPATQTPDVAEHDYSYDLAHEIPPARRD